MAGGSSQGALTACYRRIRPVNVRFTEPGLQDCKTDLVAETLVRYNYSSNRSRRRSRDERSKGRLRDRNGSRKGKERALDDDEEQLLQYDSDSSDASTSSSTSTVLATAQGTDAADRKRRPKSITILKRTDSTVQVFKQRIKQDHLPSTYSQRNLRLIHAGRILREDGIKLVDWLDTLDAKRQQSLSIASDTGSNAAVGEPAALAGQQWSGNGPLPFASVPVGATISLRDAAETGADFELETQDGDRIVQSLERQGLRAGKEAVKAARNLGGWIENRIGGAPVLPLVDLPTSSDDVHPSIQTHVLFDSSEDEDGVEASGEAAAPPSSKARGKRRAIDEAPSTSDIAEVHESKADVVYIQCSIGAEDVLFEEAPSVSDATNVINSDAPSTDPQSATGFDRLRLTAGLGDEDISTMRYHFQQARLRQGLVDRSGDVLRREEEDEHARALEEQWIDGMVGEMDGRDPATVSAAGDAAAAGARANARPAWTLWIGMVIGFFLPVVSLSAEFPLELMC